MHEDIEAKAPRTSPRPRRCTFHHDARHRRRLRPLSGRLGQRLRPPPRRQYFFFLVGVWSRVRRVTRLPEPTAQGAVLLRRHRPARGTAPAWWATATCSPLQPPTTGQGQPGDLITHIQHGVTSTRLFGAIFAKIAELRAGTLKRRCRSLPQRPVSQPLPPNCSSAVERSNRQSARQGFEARCIGERQARGRTEVRDEHALRGPTPAMHDHDLGPNREGACRRSVQPQDGIATAQGQQLLVEAIGRRVSAPFFEIELGAQEGQFHLRVRDRVAQVRVGEGAKGGELRAATFGDEPAQLGSKSVKNRNGVEPRTPAP